MADLPIASDDGATEVEIIQSSTLNKLAISAAGAITVLQGTSPWVVSLGSTTITGTVAVTQSTSPWVISAASLPLPTGASTSALQTTGNTSLASIDTKTPALGQALMAASSPVVIASNQSAIPVTGTFFQATQPISGTVTANQGTSPWVVSLASTTITGTVAVTQSTSPWITTANIGTTGGLALDATLTGGTQQAIALGAVTTAAPVYTTGTNNKLSLNTAGGLRVDGSGVTQPVSGTFWQATQPVNGTVAATQSGVWGARITGNAGAILDAATSQNVATPANGLAVLAEFNTTPATITSGNSSPLQLTASGKLIVDGSQVTQPVSVASLPLPTGAATSALQTTGNTSLATIATNTTGVVVAQASTTAGQSGQLVQGAVTTANPTYTTGQTDPLSLTTAGALRTDNTSWLGSTAPTVGQKTMANSVPVVLASDESTLPISAASLPLPTGAATSALQTTANTSLAAIDAGIPAALGQTTMSASMPVVIASDQTPVPVTFSTAAATNVLKTAQLVSTATTADQVVLTYTVTAGKTLYLQYVIMGGYLTSQPGNANPIDLGDMHVQTPSGTTFIQTERFHPKIADLVVSFPQAIPIAAGVAIRITVTPVTTTSITWEANFGGYER